MTKRLVSAIALEPLDRPPVWIMRQAGRHLPEYREVRRKHGFQDIVNSPELAAKVTMQPIERYGMDGAVIFADIMTPLEAMGVDMVFDPGPKFEPLTLEQVAELPPLDPSRIEPVLETIRLVSAQVPEHTAVIGFAGAPVTLLAYLLHGGGSKDFIELRAALEATPELAKTALDRVAGSMNIYLSAQISAGADVVQLFDTWASLLGRAPYEAMAAPAARAALTGLVAPTIYFAPGAGHVLQSQLDIDAAGYGVDWRTDLSTAFDAFPNRAVQGNLDPAVLRADPDTVRARASAMLREVGTRPGYIANLGHGIDRNTPPECVAAFVGVVRS